MQESVVGLITMTNCQFSANHATIGDGGGADLKGGPALLQQCGFLSNSAFNNGGGVSVQNDSKFMACTFRDNQAVNFGAGIIDNHAIVTLVNCEAAGNHGSVRGGCVANLNGQLRVHDSTIVGNAAAIGGGVYADSSGSTTILLNNILWANQDASGQGQDAQVVGLAVGTLRASYCCIQGWTGALAGIHTFASDPQFVDADGLDDVYGTNDDDMHLLASSPCIDAGDNWGVPHDAVTGLLVNVDHDAQSRFAHGPIDSPVGCGVPVIVDMGAFEFPGPGPQSIAFADVVIDAAVNVDDLFATINSWGPCGGCCVADFNLDGTVSIDDIMIVIANWDQNT